MAESADYNLIQDTTGATITGTTTNNITGVDPLLGALGANGGSTLTHGLDAASPAIGTGSCTDTTGTTVLIDQTGTARPQGCECDIGAVELAVSAQALVFVTAEPAGVNCATGGARVDGGLDYDDDGALAACEITSTQYVCNGAAGATGAAGAAGTNGTNGADGATGVTGATGADGAAGADGKDGAAGSGGCSATKPASFAFMLAALILATRKRRRAFQA